MQDGRARIRRLGGALWLGLGLAALAAPAAAQPVPAAPKPAPDPALEAARAAFEGLAEAERRAIQDALVWTGDHSGLVDGSFGRQTFEAIAAFQRRLRVPPSGILDTRARASLQADAKRAREAAGFATVDDPKTGIRLGIPARLLPKRDVNPNGGGRWQSPDGRITLDTRAITGPDANLQALFDRNLAIQTPGRQVTYKLLRPDFFVIAGETATGRFYMRYAAGPDGLRGFSIGYDKALAGEVDRSVVAIANSFAPFPSAARPTLESAPAPPPPPPKPAAPVLLGSGLAVGPGRVITTAAMQGCADLRVGGRPPRQRTESRQGLTVFEVEPAPRPGQPPLAPAAPESSVLVMGFAGPPDAPQLMATPGRVEGGLLQAPLQAGASGAVLIDRAGGLVGLVAAIRETRRAVAGVVPLGTYAIVPGAALGEVMPAAAAAPVDPAGAGKSAAELGALMRALVVPIQCGP
jgi:peptidoglycan hydrolase-like protein with peptidoglycan-binding domain